MITLVIHTSSDGLQRLWVVEGKEDKTIKKSRHSSRAKALASLGRYLARVDQFYLVIPEAQDNGLPE